MTSKTPALPTSTFKFLFYFVKKQWVKFSLISFAFMVWAVMDAIFPYFLKLIINTVETYQGERAGIYVALSGVLFFVVLCWIISELAMRLQGIMQIYTFPIFRTNIREAVFNYVKSHSHEYFSSNFTGNIAKKISDLPTSSQSIVEIICCQFVTATTGAIIVLVMMWVTKPFFAILLFTWLCLHLAITFILLRYSDSLWEAHSSAVSTLSGNIVDVFSNMMNVRLFARNHYEADYLKRFQHEEIHRAKKAMWAVELLRVGLGLNGLFLIIGMVFSLIHGWVHGWVTIGDFTQVSMQSFWLLGWIWYVSFQLTIFTRESGTIANALSLIRQEHGIIDAPDAKPLVVAQGEIRFERVNFSYQEKRIVFRELNVTIPAGKKIGLVGFSGSGKSTFVNLILRFYDLQSGRILIDNQDIAHVTQDSLRANISMIPQEPALFHRSLLDNIRYGRLDATEAEIITAAKLAHCDEFIRKLDDQYHSLVGERGVKLSGGQRQRIAIARAVLKNAPILILDEATSALDSVTEKLIQESLAVLMQNRTTLVIAHRLSTLADMDEIYVFDKGTIIEQGTKTELLEKDGYFAKLWNMQTDGFLPDHD